MSRAPADAWLSQLGYTLKLVVNVGELPKLTAAALRGFLVIDRERLLLKLSNGLNFSNNNYSTHITG